MTAFFSRFSRLISAIRGACRRHSSGVTRLLSFAQIGAVAASTASVKANRPAALPGACVAESIVEPSAMVVSLCSS